MTRVYLVGDDNSPKNNSWLAMTNDRQEAERLLIELEKATRLKTIEVKANEGR